MYISSDASNIAFVSTNPTMGTNQGLALSQQNPMIVMDWEYDKTLVMAAWYLILFAGAICHVEYICMRRDPRDYGYQNAYLSRAPSPDRALRATQRMRRSFAPVSPRRSGLYSRIARTNPDLWE